jgi:hypothetical protein
LAAFQVITEVINQKLKELAGLVEERERIQEKITKIESAIRSFIALLDDEISQQIYTVKLRLASKPIGLTEVVKREVQEAGKITLGALRDRLTESGFQLSGYSNPLAVLYTTLSRLEDQKFIKKHENGEYEWIVSDTFAAPRKRFLETLERIKRNQPAPRLSDK